MKKIMFSVGEPSGEMLAIEVIKKLKNYKDDELYFFGMGGKNLQSHSFKLIVNSTDLAVIGFIEVFNKWFSLKKALKKLHYELIRNRPDILILVDYVEFNLRLGQIAKSLGIPVIFYVSPQIWAWGKKRMKRIENAADKIACILPFEVDLYKSSNINVTYVGHPLVEILSSFTTHSGYRDKLKFSSNDKIIGILPGSRVSELARHLPVLKETILRLYKFDKKIIFLLAGASKSLLSNILTPWKYDLEQKGVKIEVIYENTYEIIAKSNVVAVASGTATLETALIGTPMVVFYKTSNISYFVLKKIITVKYISLVNILLNSRSIAELIQNNANPVSLSNAILDLLNSDQKQNKQLSDFAEIRNILGKKSASETVSKLILDIVN